MRILIRLMTLCAALFLALGLSDGRAQTPSPAEARRVLDILRDPKATAALAATLETIARVPVPAAPPIATVAGAAPITTAPPIAPAAPASSLSPTSPVPASPAPVPPAPVPPAPVAPAPTSIVPAPALAPDSLAARLLVGASEKINHLTTQFLTGVAAIKSLPALLVWLETMTTDPLARETLIEVAWRLVVAAAAALVIEWVIWRLLARPRVWLAARAPQVVAPPAEPGEAEEDAAATPATRRRRATAWTLLRRLPLVVGMLMLDVLPIAAFALAGHVLAATGLGHTNFMRLVLLGAVDAYVAVRVVLAVGRMLLSPDFPRLRMLQWSDAAAAYGVRWLRRIVVVFVSGNALAEVGLLFGLSSVAHDALLKATGLVVHVMVAIVVWQKRRAVCAALRAPAGASGAVAMLRNRLAAIWHWVAQFYIAAVWIVWAVEVRDGYQRMINVFLSMFGTIVAARLLTIVAFGALDRAMHVRPSLAARVPGLERRARFYHPILRGILGAVIWLVAAGVLLQIWGVGALSWLVGTALGLSVLGALVTIAITLMIALIVWEGTNIAIELHLAKLTAQAQMARSARIRTLLPLLRTLLIGVLLVITLLMVLSEIGVNIAPLLAGAGILGVAIGFGSQKLVQDLITGIFLLLENAMQVGDWVTVSGLTGTVENLSVRTIRLRAGDGSVHIIPFSAVTSVTNTNRGLGNASVNVTVNYKEDTDRVSRLLDELVEEMRADADFRAKILSPLQLWGVDKVDGSSVTIVGQIVCTDAGRWSVQREFNRRLKLRFQEEGIGIYNPAQQYLLERQSPAPSATPAPALAAPMTRLAGE